MEQSEVGVDTCAVVRVFCELDARARSAFDAHKFCARLGEGMNLRFAENVLGLHEPKVAKMFQAT